MSQATIASRQRMSTARCYLDPIRSRQNLRIETGALTEGLVLDGKRCTGVRYSVGRRRARGAGGARGRGQRGHRSTRRNCSSCRASASRSACGRSASRSAMRCRASARTCATTMRRARAGRSARRASPSTTAAAGSAWSGRRCAMPSSAMACSAMVGAPIRAFVRSREGLAAPDLLLGWVPMLTEPGPKGPRIARQSGMTCYAHPMRPESRGHIHIVSADREEAAGDQLQLPVVAGRRRAHGARRSHRLLDHARAGARPLADHRDRAGRRTAAATTRSSTG